MDNKFMFFEKLFFRIQMSLLAIGLGTLLIMFAFVDRIENTTNTVVNFFIGLMFTAIAGFVINIIRLIKYLIRYKSDEDVTIKRTVIGLLTAPISTIVLFIIWFVLALSMASCTAG